MDNFKKHIKETYQSEFSTTNPEAAWLKFEKENLSEDTNPIFFWKFIIAGFLLVGLLSYLFYFTDLSFESKKRSNKQTASSDEIFIVKEEQETLISNKSEDLNADFSLNGGGAISRQFMESKEYLKNKSSITSGHSFSDGNTSIQKTAKEINRSKLNFQNQIYFDNSKLNPRNDSQNHDAKVNSTNGSNKKEKISQISSNNKVALLEITPLQKFSHLPPNVESKAFPDIKKTNIKSNSGLSIFLGASIGLNDLQHRFISKARGTNFGLISGLYINKRISLKAQINYGRRKFYTFYNSQDLRISSIQLRSIATKTENIVKEYEHLNMALSINYTIIKRGKFFLELGCGFQNKWDLSQKNLYNLKDDEKIFSERTQTTSDYQYPLFYEYSVGLGTKLYNGTSLTIRPYVSTQLLQRENIQPREVGINAEFIYQF